MEPSSTSIVVFGASGRMGSRIVELALRDASVRVVGALTRAESSSIGRVIGADHGARVVLKSPGEIDDCAGARAIIDFSSDDGALVSSHAARTLSSALLIGTTALAKSTLARLKELSTIVPVLVAPNTSLGVTILSSTIANVARALGSAYRCSIVEAHHDQKKDAPSGTALRLAQAVRGAGARLDDDQILAIRSGDVIGEHTVRFAGPGEYLEFTHRATSRDVFARGAIRAAVWLAQQKPGWYTMNDMLGIDA